MDLLTLASRHRSWLAVAQTTVAENIANATTPVFKAREVEPFEKYVGSAETAVPMQSSPAGQIKADGEVPAVKVEPSDDGRSVTHSGNAVVVEDQLMKAGDIKRDYSLNVSVTQAFRRMLLMGLKG